VLHEVEDVLRGPGEEVVEADHLDAAVEEVLAQVRAEEARSAGDDGAPDGPGRGRRIHHEVRHGDVLPIAGQRVGPAPSCPAAPPTHVGRDVSARRPTGPAGYWR
jgi:hypothetical protein